MSLPLAETRLKTAGSAVPESVSFPQTVKEFVEARGYDLALLGRGDKIGMSYSKKGFRPLLVSDLPDNGRDEFLADIRHCFFRSEPDESITFGDCQLYVRPKAQAAHFERVAQERWEALNSPETVYSQTDEWNQHFRNAGIAGRVMPVNVPSVEDHANNRAERELAENILREEPGLMDRMKELFKGRKE